jgi:LMBR1 domain-containing protein 1
LFEEIVVLAVVLVGIGLSFYWLNEARIPVRVVSSSALFLQPSNTTLVERLVLMTNETTNSTNSTNSTTFASEEAAYWTEITVPVSLVTYTVGVMSFFGYLLLVVFGGIGLGALPLDLLMSYRMRPVFVSF